MMKRFPAPVVVVVVMCAVLLHGPHVACECNVRDFGAVDDGKTDNTAAIQAAIASCA